MSQFPPTCARKLKLLYVAPQMSVAATLRPQNKRRSTLQHRMQQSTYHCRLLLPTDGSICDY